MTTDLLSDSYNRLLMMIKFPQLKGATLSLSEITILFPCSLLRCDLLMINRILTLPHKYESKTPDNPM